MSEHTGTYFSEDQVLALVADEDLELAIFLDLTLHLSRDRYQLFVYRAHPTREGQPLRMFVKDNPANEDLQEVKIRRDWLYRGLEMFVTGVREATRKSLKPELLGHPGLKFYGENQDERIQAELEEEARIQAELEEEAAAVGAGDQVDLEEQIADEIDEPDPPDLDEWTEMAGKLNARLREEGFNHPAVHLVPSPDVPHYSIQCQECGYLDGPLDPDNSAPAIWDCPRCARHHVARV